MSLFKKDLSPDQISGRLRVQYPGQPEKQASTSTIYKHIYQETAKDPSLKDHFRQNQAKPRKRSGVQDRRGQIIGRISIEERPKIVEAKNRVGDWGCKKRFRFESVKEHFTEKWDGLLTHKQIKRELAFIDEQRKR
jgi:IS30 family transposase